MPGKRDKVMRELTGTRSRYPAMFCHMNTPPAHGCREHVFDSPLGHSFLADLPHLTYRCLSVLHHPDCDILAASLCLLAMVLVTDVVIKPVTFPAAPPQRDGHAAVGLRTTCRTLPLPAIAAPRTSSVVYGMAAVDCRGRIADRAALTALSWTPGTRLDIREARGLVLIRRDDHGVFSVTRQGHLRLPATVRTAAAWSPATASSSRPTPSGTCSSSTRPQRSTTCSPSATPRYWAVIRHDDTVLSRPGRRASAADPGVFPLL